MSLFLGLGTSVLFGNTVRASTRLLTNLMDPLNPNEPLVINGNISGENINTAANSTSLGRNTGLLVTGNTFIGANAGADNNTGAGNTLLGTDAGQNITSGDNNTCLGFNAGEALTTQDSATFVGHNAGLIDEVGQSVFIGANSGENNTVATNNTFVGYQSGRAATGAQPDNNTFLGFQSGTANETGTGNTFLGASAGIANVGGFSNVFIGNQAGRDHTGGSHNVLIGVQAGAPILNGTGNVMIGSLAGQSADDLTGCVMIGRDVGLSNGTDNRLMVHNNSSEDPLLDGDMSGRTLQIKGEVTLGLNDTNVHSVNGLEDPDPGSVVGGDHAVPNAVGYIRINVNGDLRVIPFFDPSPPL